MLQLRARLYASCMSFLAARGSHAFLSQPVPAVPVMPDYVEASPFFCKLRYAMGLVADGVHVCLQDCIELMNPSTESGSKQKPCLL